MPHQNSIPNQRSTLLWGLTLGALGSVLFSAKAILAKLSYQGGIDPVTLLALRMIFALPFFWAALFWEKYRNGLKPLSKQDLYKVIMLGFIGYYFSSLMDFMGLQYLSAGLERIILYLCPTIVVLISAFFLKKKIEPLQWVALVTAYLGVITMFFDDLVLTTHLWIGVALVFTSAFTYAIYLIIAGQMVERVGSIRLVCYASTSATFCGVLQSLLISPEKLFSQLDWVYSLCIINSVFCTFIPMLMVMSSVRRVGSSLSAQAGMVGPVATIFLGWWFLAEIPGWIQLLGTAIVLFGVSLLLKVQPSSALSAEPD
jgi:drug/metabolite transporter (DMT)-like permease